MLPTEELRKTGLNHGASGSGAQDNDSSAFTQQHNCHQRGGNVFTEPQSFDIATQALGRREPGYEASFDIDLHAGGSFFTKLRPLQVMNSEPSARMSSSFSSVMETMNQLGVASGNEARSGLRRGGKS